MAALSHLKNKKESRLRDGIDKVKIKIRIKKDYILNLDHGKVWKQSRREYFCEELS